MKRSSSIKTGITVSSVPHPSLGFFLARPSSPGSFEPVVRRLFQCLVVVTLIFAVGGHWAFLQSVAWVGMTYNYSKTDTLLVAVQKSLSGQHPCKLCKVVDEGKKEEQKHAMFKVEHLEFLQIVTTLAVYPPVIQDKAFPDPFRFIIRSACPPTPPPRVA
jgi:hypothetical protein